MKKIVSFLCALTFIFTLINIPAVNSKAEERKITIEPSPDILRILEITPGDAKTLSSSDSKKVNVTSMTMSEYISRVDDIRGTYDVLVISNKISSDMPNKYWVDRTYRQYTEKFSQNMSHAKYLATGGNADGNLDSYRTSNHSINGKSIKEYYPENDITKKRSKEITDMIDCGQLVYMDKSILSEDLKNSNLYTIFNPINKDNFKKVVASSITLDDIINDYNNLKITSKRPKMQSVIEPESEVKNASGEITKKRTMNFSFEINTENEEKFKMNLYLDYDGDGLYEESEKAISEKEFTGYDGYKDYSFQYPINNNYIGYLGWKVELVRDSGVKSSYSSYTIFKAQNGKKEIKVLQIYPDKDSCYYFDNRTGVGKNGKTKLNDSSGFMKLLKADEVYDDYDISIDQISATDFTNSYGQSDDKKHLKGEYDMVIVGFADSYNGKDIKGDALNDLDKFIEDGNSVMFTHDTIGLEIEGIASGPEEFAKHYKDYVGQSRYDDPYRNGDESNLYKSKSGETSNIYHESIPDTNSVSLGITSLSMNGEQDGNGMQRGSRLWETTQTTKVRNINNGQITKWPYDLGQLNSGDGTVNVSLTHTQWYQLNLEDEDVVPWYNLAHDSKTIGKFNSGDSRNFYYTYSKENITYSGTGHSGVGDEEQEYKLFINTIVKAEQGANHAPDLCDKDISGNVIDGKDNIVFNNNKDFVFYATPSDVDNDLLNLSISLNIDGNDVNSKDIVFEPSNNNIETNTNVKVTIPNSYFKDLVKDKEVIVKVKAEDPLKDYVEKEFTLVTLSNHPPTIVNKDALNNEIVKGAIIEAKVDNDFEFISTINDEDAGDKLFAKIEKTNRQTNNYEFITDTKVNDNIITSKTPLDSESTIKSTISKSELSKYQVGDKIIISTSVKDSFDEEDSKFFIIELVEGNTPPDTTNYLFNENKDYINEFGNQIKSYIDTSATSEIADAISDASNRMISKETDYTFVTVPEDLDLDDVISVSVKASVCDDQGNDNGSNVYAELSLFDSDKASKSIVCASKVPVKVTIPMSLYKNSNANDLIRITVAVNDESHDIVTRTFFVKISDITGIHGVVTSADPSGNVGITTSRYQIEEGISTCYAAKIMGVKSENPKLTLLVDSKMIVDGKVSVYRIINGIPKDLGELTVVDPTVTKNLLEGKFTSDDILKLGDIEDEGVTFLIKYNASLLEPSTNMEKDYYNTIKIDDKYPWKCNVFTQKDNLPEVVPKLF